MGEGRGPNVPGGCPPNLIRALLLTVVAMLLHPKEMAEHWRSSR